MKASTAVQPLVAALIALSGGCVGSGSVALPPPLSSSQAKRLQELPLPYTVGVARDPLPAQSDQLLKALKSANIFKRVAPLQSYSHPPDMIATYEEKVVGGANNLPLMTLLSAGVIPTGTKERQGFIFSLAPSSNPRRKTMINAHYRGLTTLGWAGLAAAATPGYTSGDYEDSTRFRDFIAYRTLSTLRPIPNAYGPVKEP